jgi:hypothetical protein
MKDFDDNVYYPERRALFQECKALGHPGSRKFHNNGLGWTFEYCGCCKQVCKMYGPDGEDEEV